MSKTTVGKGFQLDWFEQEISLVIDKATSATLRAAAFQILNWARVKIQQNGQIDTSFMWNSGYVVTHKENNYNAAVAAAKAANPKAKFAPSVSLPKSAGALVAFGANYALWQEIVNSFLRWAFQQVAKEMPAVLKIAKKSFSF